MSNGFRSAGFWVAHAAWSIEDGEVLIPLLSFVSREGTRRAARVDFDDYEESVAYGLKKLEANEAGDASGCFIYDGYTPPDMGRQDALVAYIRDYLDPTVNVTILLPYERPNESSLRILREKVMSTSAMDEDKLEACMDAYLQGIAEHAEGERIWSGPVH